MKNFTASVKKRLFKFAALKKRDASKQKDESKKASAYLFAEPFCMIYIGGVKRKEAEKVARNRCRFLLDTEDFFFAVRPFGKGYAAVAIASQADEEAHRTKWYAKQFPILLHLKPGKKYAIWGEKVCYNVDLSGSDGVKILVHTDELDGYVKPKSSDLEPPRYGLVWNLDKKEHTWFLASMGAAIAFLFLLNLVLSWKVATVKAKKELAAKKLVVRSNPVFGQAQRRENLSKIVSTINEVEKKIRGSAYIKKLTFSQDKLVFEISCISKGCFVPLPVEKKRDVYVFKKSLKP